MKIIANIKCGEGTVGEFVRDLLTELDYYGTRLPLPPSPAERDMKGKLEEEEEIEQRAKRHEENGQAISYFDRVERRPHKGYIIIKHLPSYLIHLHKRSVPHKRNMVCTLLLYTMDCWQPWPQLIPSAVVSWLISVLPCRMCYGLYCCQW